MATDGPVRRRIHLDGELAQPVQRRPPAAAPAGGISAAPTPPPSAVSDADRSTAAALESDLRVRAQTLQGEAARIARSIARGSDDAARSLESELVAAEHELRDGLDWELRAAEERFAEQRGTLALALRRSAEAIAPGAAGMPWSESWSKRDRRPATHVRFGTFPDGSPALAPLLENRGWAVAGDREAAQELIRQTVLRTTAQIPLRFLRIRSYDPRIEGPLGLLSVLRDANPDSYPQPAHTAEEFRAAIADVTAAVSSAAEQINARQLRTLGELWLDEGRPTHPYTLVVVYSYPLGVDEATQSALVRLAASGSARGVSLLVHVDADERSERDVNPADLLDKLTAFSVHAGDVRTPLFDQSMRIRLDDVPPRDAVKSVLDRSVAEVSEDTGPTVPLEEILNPYLGQLWNESAFDGIEAIIGLRGRKEVRLALRSENPPHPNLLIGGAVGQGKSNLLLTIVYSLAARYAPDELEMLLLDFKQGLEFTRFGKDADGKNWLPHARVLSLESSKPFGLAVLEFVQRELERRAQLFNAARCNGFREYRQKTGRPMARMLLIIDEFQVLFDGNDDVTAEAVLLFEQLARQGRAYGIHMLLSSQTVSGISGLQVKGDSIFAQFPLRVSLKNTPEESQAILSRGNTAAADLTYRGEVVVNRNYGLPASNEIAVAAHAESGWISGLQRQLWEAATEPREPWVFFGRGFAPWPMVFADSGPLCARIGRPIGVTDAVVELPFRDDIDQTVAVVGSGGLEATAVLGAAIVTMTGSWGHGARVVLLDGRPGTDTTDPILGEALGQLQRRGIEIMKVQGGDVPRYLMYELAPSLRSNTRPTLVLAVQTQRIAEMEDEVPVDPDVEFGDRISGLSALQELSVQGGANQLHLIGWWPSLRAVASQLGFDHRGVSRYVLLKVGIEDLRQVAGPHAQPAEGWPRVHVFDRSAEDGDQVVVPFAPLGETV